MNREQRRCLLVNLVAPVMCVMCLCASSTLAGEPPPVGEFTYQGQLTNDGTPVSGDHDFWFTLWDSESGGQQIAQFPGNGSPVSIAVGEGLFSAAVNFGTGVFTHEARWLQIEFDAGADGVVTLSRQLIRATPYAIQTRGLFVNGMGSLLVLPDSGDADFAAGFRVDGSKLYATAPTAGSQQDVMQLSAGASMFLDQNGDAAFFINNSNGRVGIGTDSPQDTLHVSGVIRSGGVRLVGGADIAEPFDVRHDGAVIPGMVVSIDPKSVGGLCVADLPYDARVAGIVSGAGGINAAMTLSQEDTIADGEHPVALTGRVWCLVDADANGPITAGDLLTTSATPGHAMRASDRTLAFGSTIGKAMTSLESGRGLVLVLVNLH